MGTIVKLDCIGITSVRSAELSDPAHSAEAPGLSLPAIYRKPAIVQEAPSNGTKLGQQMTRFAARGIGRGRPRGRPTAGWDAIDPIVHNSHQDRPIRIPRTLDVGVHAGQSRRADGSFSCVG
jgi:hypothetical protein